MPVLRGRRRSNNDTVELDTKGETHITTQFDGGDGGMGVAGDGRSRIDTGWDSRVPSTLSDVRAAEVRAAYPPAPAGRPRRKVIRYAPFDTTKPVAHVEQDR